MILCRCTPFLLLLGFAFAGVLLVSGKLKPRPDNRWVPRPNPTVEDAHSWKQRSACKGLSHFWCTQGLR